MTMEAYREIEIKEQRFRIGRMTAMVGARILNTLTLATLKQQSEAKPNVNTEAAQSEFNDSTAEEKADSTVEIMWLAGGPSLSEEKYSQIQTQCLQLCSMYPDSNGAAPVPILMSNGRWAVKELETDISTVNQLIQEALKFNLSPFFTESASKAATAEALSSQPLTRQ
jgi:hypothetical protein